MTYTALALVGVVTAVALDRWIVRTRLTTTRAWWATYAIIIFFQLLTNGWLTGRGIVRYAPDAIIGTDRVTFLGAGRLVYAPVEDVAFGFALVLTTCCVWVWLGRRSGADAPSSPTRALRRAGSHRVTRSRVSTPGSGRAKPRRDRAGW